MRPRLRRAGALFFITLFISVFLSIASKTALQYLPLIPGVMLLVVIVFLGIVFDIIGVAVTAAEERPLHAMASDRLPGAVQAIWLVRNADQVASFANDVIGDIAGTLSGAIGASIVFVIVTSMRPGIGEAFLMTLMVGLIAGLTVGGKSYGKGFAISRSNEIVYRVGELMFAVESLTGLKIWRVGKNKRHRKTKGSGNGQKRNSSRKKKGRKETPGQVD